MRLGRRVGVAVSGSESGRFRPGMASCGSGPRACLPHSRSSRLPSPAPIRRAPAPSDCEPAWSRGGSRSESAGLRRPLVVDSWAPSGAPSAPGSPVAGAAPVGRWPAWRARAPFPSRASCSWFRLSLSRPPSVPPSSSSRQFSGCVLEFVATMYCRPLSCAGNSDASSLRTGPGWNGPGRHLSGPLSDPPLLLGCSVQCSAA
jgi:hypothetical protein